MVAGRKERGNKWGREGGRGGKGGREILKDIQDVNTLSIILKDAEMWSKIYFSNTTSRTFHRCDGTIIAQLK